MQKRKFLGIIPARYASSRFPGKPLVDILGKTMIRRVYEQASQCRSLDQVVVATDDEQIAAEVQSFGGQVVMTSADHPSGTDRCAEVVAKTGTAPDSIIINIQGDEPFIDPEQIDLLCTCFHQPEVELATLVRRFSSGNDILNPNTIKVVLDTQGFALYFSRLPIPFERDARQGMLPDVNAHFQHIGLYGYRAATLLEVAKLPPSKLESTEKLEQLRWLEHGYRIMTALSEHESWSVDAPEDLKKIYARFS
ncbi:MAG: 3-deoxy-manno-octulosonate cytidylyltransferase [Bacteroidia bacterium]|nr:3-deoxy-manno-octulosonate cytidylyltransferase [Bacteroidia bacterium]MCC6769449.1 3-deoxy-manno-octulosonate cytidylyltransferase [Bacteroidia bacterium]